VGAPPLPPPGIATAVEMIEPPAPTRIAPVRPLRMKRLVRTKITSGPGISGKMSATAMKPAVWVSALLHRGMPPGVAGLMVMAFFTSTISGKPSSLRSATVVLKAQPATAAKSSAALEMSWPLRAVQYTRMSGMPSWSRSDTWGPPVMLTATPVVRRPVQAG
jgi:hypothetical protein